MWWNGLGLTEAHRKIWNIHRERDYIQPIYCNTTKGGPSDVGGIGVHNHRLQQHEQPRTQHVHRPLCVLGG